MRPIPGFLHPDNANEGSIGFKEGLVRVDAAAFKVHQPPVAEGTGETRNPFLALVWNVTRLDEDKTPLIDNENNPLTEEVIFSLGGKSLQHAHPGICSNYEDEDVEDAGVDINAEGPTIYLTNATWRPDKKSGLVNLQLSLKDKGVDSRILNRVWAPDYVGGIVFLKNQPSGQTIQRPDKTGKLVDQTFSYKVVDKIERAFGLGAEPKKRAAATKTAGHAANGKTVESSEVEAKLKPILDEIGMAQIGKTISKKALAATVNKMLTEQAVPPPIFMPIMNMVRDDAWLTANAAKYEFTYADNQVTF